MMKLKANKRRQQRGAALILALIVLVLGSLVVTGLLYYVNTSILSHAKAVDRMEARYAADAGVEWLAADLLAENTPATGVDIYGGSSVNGLTPVVIVSTIAPNTPEDDITQYVLTSSADGATISATIQHWTTANEVRVDIWEIS